MLLVNVMVNAPGVVAFSFFLVGGFMLVNTKPEERHMNHTDGKRMPVTQSPAIKIPKKEFAYEKNSKSD